MSTFSRVRRQAACPGFASRFASGHPDGERDHDANRVGIRDHQLSDGLDEAYDGQVVDRREEGCAYARGMACPGGRRGRAVRDFRPATPV
jgi:hypothetical protein